MATYWIKGDVLLKSSSKDKAEAQDGGRSSTKSRQQEASWSRRFYGQFHSGKLDLTKSFV